ncbi:lysylphosphatidylglycerol synthase transmembrane domain-containing protein [Geodermatophilus sp. DSM 45219]|uniref:lysylphosphatidylglycerol synthase transmembrane domain-containing protein n=1 Tax=Geodermatophilus sp. DSM 45219 TaxID=1881103 RepID=UPI000887137C|nr:lysylphosphatidylglycerol synthase transmembrane domain-containing protein [Geodermatophilus sp. DSM 45219]SDO46939.1 undecaprenyl-diphosphatase [Geodermatophilus sp. DSM 45219]
MSGDRTEEEVTGYERSPSDVLRTVVFAVLALLLLGLARWARDESTALDEDLVQRLSFLTPAVGRILAGAVTLLVLASLVGAWAAPLVTRHARLLGHLLISGVLAVLLLLGAGWLVDRADTDALVAEVARRGGVDSTLTVDGVAVMAASFVVLGPFVSRRWRRAGARLLALVVLLRLLVPIAHPGTLAVALVLGALAGSATLLLLGRPSRRPTLGAVAAALTGGGLPPADLHPAVVDARGSVPYVATLQDGGRVFTKVMGADNRAADLLFRVYRFLRLKDVGDERPFSSLRRTVEHEALVSLLVRDAGARTPRLRAIAPVGSDSFLLSYDLVDGSTLDRLPPDSVPPLVLSQIWEQVAVLRRHSVAHRDLRRANILLDPTGTPWLIDFGFSEVAASPALLDADVAQLLVALALDVGVEPAVDAAIDRLGPEAVAAALPRLQPNSLSGATRDALRHRKEQLLPRIRAAVCRRSGVPEPELADLERIHRTTVLTVVLLVAATYLLAPQLGDVGGMVARVRAADWVWLPWILAVSALTYAGATLSIVGAVPARLRPLTTFVAQLASSFASKLAPAGLGGMALNVRYLQKSGVDLPVATSGVGLSYAAGSVVHVVLMVVFAVWAGQSAFGSLRLPRPQAVLWGVLVVLALAAAALAVPAVRRLVVARLVPLVQRSVHGVGPALRRPGKLALLLGGAAVVTLGYLVCLYLSTRAFGGGLGLATVGAVYLVGAAVAAAAPTPGGLGALEAALIAGLVAAGMDHTVAVPAVFLYRLATFWLPILPGWAAFAWLRRSDHV